MNLRMYLVAETKALEIFCEETDFFFYVLNSQLCSGL